MSTDTELPTPISRSWTTGYYVDFTLHVPISAARAEVAVASGSEDFCRALWQVILNRLDVWKVRHGSPPDRSGPSGLFAMNEWDDLSDDQVPAYGWTGRRFDTFADLLARLIDEKYAPITELVEQFSKRLFWAVVTLAEAATGSRSAVNAYGYLESARRDALLEHNEAILADIAALAPHIAKGARFSQGRRPGSVDGLSKLLDRLLRDDPDITNKDAWKRLVSRFPDEIRQLDDGSLEWRGSEGKCNEVSEYAFAARMTAARQRRKK